MGSLEVQLQSDSVEEKVQALQDLKFTESEFSEGELTSLTRLVAELLGDPDWSVREASTDVFFVLGERCHEHSLKVGQLLSSTNPGVVAAAAYALSGVGEKAASQVQALEVALGNRGEDRSTLVLAKSGAAPKAVAALRKPTCAAALALAAVGKEGARCAPKVAALLKESDWEVRSHAASALGGMGKEGAKFESDVLALINDKVPHVAAAAVASLGQMALSAGASESVASAVADCFNHHSPMVRAVAAKAMGEMGEEGQTYLPRLLKLFQDSSPAVVSNAIHGISGCGPLGQMYAGKVVQMAYDNRPDIRVAAILAVPQFGKRGFEFKDEILRLLEDEKQDVSDAAFEVIQMIENERTMEEDADVLPVALLFPGQGSQYQKMLSEVKELPGVQDLLAKAQTILGYDLLQICLNGTDEELNRTQICQPAVYVSDLAAVELLKDKAPDLLNSVAAVAGLSLGEYAALCVAGVWDFETGLQLVKVRGEAMQEASMASAQAMASVAGLDRTTLTNICKLAAGPGEVCQIANHLFPKGFSCSGSQTAIEKLIDSAKEAGALQAKLVKAGGAFHTALMEPARQKLTKALREMEPQMKPTKFAVYLNVTGERIEIGTPPADIIPMLADQLVSPVLWEDSVKNMIGDGITDFYECGPMKQLKAMMKRIDIGSWNKMQNYHV